MNIDHSWPDRYANVTSGGQSTTTDAELEHLRLRFRCTFWWQCPWDGCAARATSVLQDLSPFGAIFRWKKMICQPEAVQKMRQPSDQKRWETSPVIPEQMTRELADQRSCQGTRVYERPEIGKISYRKSSNYCTCNSCIVLLKWTYLGYFGIYTAWQRI